MLINRHNICNTSYISPLLSFLTLHFTKTQSNMLKRVIVLFIGITSLSVSSFAQEQTNIISTKTVKTLSKTPDYAMGVSTEKHLKAAIQLFHQFETSGVT